MALPSGSFAERQKADISQIRSFRSFSVRDDLLKIQHVLYEAKIISRNRIENFDDLYDHVAKLQTEVEELERQIRSRKVLPADKEELKKKLKEKRKELNYCDHITERSLRLDEGLTKEAPQKVQEYTDYFDDSMLVEDGKLKDEAKRYGLKYGVIIDVNKPVPDDEVALFIKQNDAVKLECILDSLKVAALEPDLDSVKIEDDKANVIKAEVKLKEDEKNYSYERAFGHKRKEEEDDPLAKTPSAETSTASADKSKNPSVRKEIEKIRVEIEAEEKAEKIRNRNKKWKGKGSEDEAKVKSMRK